MKIAVILSYYERPDLLELCMTALDMQTRRADELIVIDDGSVVPPPYHGSRYIRHDHDGYRKYRLCNRAILETDADYLIFLDQDCVVPPDFIRIHESIAKPGYYICAMYSSLTADESRLVTPETITDETIWKLISTRYGGAPHVWCGAGSAVWRKDALAVNGFDNRLGLVGPDINFGLRLSKMGLGWDHFNYYGSYFHLWHDKPYAVTGEAKARELTLARLLAAESVRTPNGIAELFD